MRSKCDKEYQILQNHLRRDENKEINYRDGVLFENDISSSEDDGNNSKMIIISIDDGYITDDEQEEKCFVSSHSELLIHPIYLQP